VTHAALVPRDLLDEEDFMMYWSDIFIVGGDREAWR
jgi:hypothetical protein